MAESRKSREGVASAVRLVVVVKRVVPPRTVFFLFFENVTCEMGDEFLLVLGREHEETLARVIKSVIVKVAGDGKMSFVRDGALTGNIKPAFA